jgi:hypothetical protein
MSRNLRTNLVTAAATTRLCSLASDEDEQAYLTASSALNFFDNETLLANMTNVTAHIDAKDITDWASFHDVFASTMGFPSFYGRNMDAWIDCMSCLDEPEAGLTKIFVKPGGQLALHIDDASGLRVRCPEIYAALVECVSFVNARRTDGGLPPVIDFKLNG